MVASKDKRHFDLEFKYETICLMDEGKRSVRDIAKDSDIHPNVLHQWRRNNRVDIEHAFPGKETAYFGINARWFKGTPKKAEVPHVDNLLPKMINGSMPSILTGNFQKSTLFIFVGSSLFFEPTRQ